jgi:hypothetical protein
MKKSGQWSEGEPLDPVGQPGYWTMCEDCERILYKHLALFESLEDKPGLMELCHGPDDGRTVPNRPAWNIGHTTDGGLVVDKYERVPGTNRAVYVGRERVKGE